MPVAVGDGEGECEDGDGDGEGGDDVGATDANLWVETEVTFPTSPSNATPLKTGATLIMTTPSPPDFGLSECKPFWTHVNMLFTLGAKQAQIPKN